MCCKLFVCCVVVNDEWFGEGGNEISASSIGYIKPSNHYR